MVTFSDFQSLEMKVGSIVAIEPVPETEKLLKLTVDCGEESNRQIISGIRHYVPDFEALAGTQAIFLTNLEPRMIKGLESQGMLLALDNDGVFALVTPSVTMPPGTMVS